MSAPRVRVHIDRLVLEGVAGFDDGASRRRLEAAVTAALIGQLRDRPIGSPSWARREVQSGGTVRVGRQPSPERLGREVATILHQGLAR
jgi:hypothetical protein